MRLDRNIEGNEGRGKYAILNLRRLALYESSDTFNRFPPKISRALKVLEAEGILEWGVVGKPNEFFLIKLKDAGAQAALTAYASVYNNGEDDEWRDEVLEMARRSGPDHPLCKRAD